MGSSFQLELDTTPPSMDMFVPNYATQSSFSEIRIVGDEDLSINQEIYAIDSKGNRHDFTFDYKRDRFEGLVFFNRIPLGGVTFYANVSDNVGNKTHIKSNTINITNSIGLTVKTFMDEAFAINRISELEHAVTMNTSKTTHSIAESDSTTGISERTHHLEVE